MDKFTFCGRVIQAISEMIMEDTIQGPDINSIHTVLSLIHIFLCLKLHQGISPNPD